MSRSPRRRLIKAKRLFVSQINRGVPMTQHLSFLPDGRAQISIRPATPSEIDARKKEASLKDWLLRLAAGGIATETRKEGELFVHTFKSKE